MNTSDLSSSISTERKQICSNRSMPDIDDVGLDGDDRPVLEAESAGGAYPRLRA